jgi:hypothetical protein
VCFCAQGFIGRNCENSNSNFNIRSRFFFLLKLGLFLYHKKIYFIQAFNTGGNTGGYTGGGGNTSPCNPNPCRNGGSCINQAGGGFVCFCAQGFIGRNCENSINNNL